MTELFRRVYSLEVGNGSEAITFDGFQDNPLQINFTIEQTPSLWLSYAEISIYGLSRETKAKIRSEYTEVKLVAGYREQYGQIFRGTIHNVESGRDGAEQFVKLYCRSGAAPGEINRSWGENTPRSEIIRDIAESFGYPVEMVGDFSGLPPAVKGFSIFMERKLAMQEQADSFGFDWMVRNQTLFVLAPGEVIPNTVYRYSATSGMVGSPRITIQGVDITVKLNPSLRPGAIFEVEAETGSFNFNEVFYKRWPDSIGIGRYKIFSMQIQGDFYGDAWDMDLQGLRR